jgi:uncharacterized membrane protein
MSLMTDLVIVGFEDEYTAFEMRAALARLAGQYLIAREDIAVVTRSKQGKVKLDQAANVNTAGAVGGGFWGTLIGLLLLNPVLGAALGASTDALAERLSEIGITRDLMKELGDALRPGTSALFVLIRRTTPQRLMDELRGFEGKVIRTSLTRTKEEELRDLLSDL